MHPRTQRDKQDQAASIFARTWSAIAGRLSPALARQVLRLDFSDADRVRMQELASRSRDGLLSASEAAELDGFVRAGDMIAILQSAARRRLKVARSGANGHG
jgi:hypothetical protein